MDTLGSVAAVLDPVLTPLGFSAGQAGGHEHEATGQLIWCAAYDAFRVSYPWLPQSSDQDPPTGYECVDLTVTLADGHIADARLEGHELAETLADLGDAAAARRAAGLTGTAARAGARTMSELLPGLFTPPRSRSGGRSAG